MDDSQLPRPKRRGLRGESHKNVEIAKLTADLAEADRRAGAAERRMVDLVETISKFNCSRDRMKIDAGYDVNVSFDVVWEETLAKAKA